MRNKNLIKDKFVIGLLQQFGFQQLLVNGKVQLNSEGFKTSETKILKFAYELLGAFLPEKSIKEFYWGLGKFHDGIRSLYQCYQIGQIIDLYFDLKNNKKLFEIGTKRCNRERVIAILERELGEKLIKIGTALIYSSTYVMWEAKKSGVLLSTYTQEEDRWYLADSTGKQVGGIVICNSSYIGIIVPGFDLTHKLAKELYERAGNTEIEFPYNGLGGININDLSKKNVTPEQAEKNKDSKDWNKRSPFVLDLKSKPKVLSML